MVSWLIRATALCSILSHTLKRYVPPGLRTRNASRTPAALSGKNMSPNSQTATSKARSGKGRFVPSAWRHSSAGSAGMRVRAWAIIASLRSVATRVPWPARRRTRRPVTIPVPQATSSTRIPRVTGSLAARSSA